MPAKSLKERALFYAHGFNPALRLFLNPTIIMHIICYLKKQWESGRISRGGSRTAPTFSRSFNAHSPPLGVRVI